MEQKYLRICCGVIQMIMLHTVMKFRKGFDEIQRCLSLKVENDIRFCVIIALSAVGSCLFLRTFPTDWCAAAVNASAWDDEAFFFLFYIIHTSFCSPFSVSSGEKKKKVANCWTSSTPSPRQILRGCQPSLPKRENKWRFEISSANFSTCQCVAEKINSP